MSKRDDKAVLRRECLRRQRELPAAFRREADARIRERLAAQPEIQAAGALAAFYPCPDEPDLRPLLAAWLAAGKTCYFPKSDGAGHYRLVPLAPGREPPFEERFRPGRFGIPEPVAAPAAPADADFPWLIPGVAFDLAGHRLGRGGGIYDRLLRATAGLRIAIAYESQLVAAVPAGPDDEPVHRLVTERDVHRCSPTAMKGN